MQELKGILEEFGSYICDDLCYYRETSADKNDEEMEEICAGCKVGKYLESIRKHMNDGWIPVEERLPEVGKRVLATYRKNRGEYDVAQDQLIKEFWCGKEEISWDSGLDSDIIVWRPLPEPYRPERSRE